jgi:hypothetical protein
MLEEPGLFALPSSAHRTRRVNGRQHDGGTECSELQRSRWSASRELQRSRWSASRDRAARAASRRPCPSFSMHIFQLALLSYRFLISSSFHHSGLSQSGVVILPSINVLRRKSHPTALLKDSTCKKFRKPRGGISQRDHGVTHLEGWSGVSCGQFGYQE